MPEPRITATLRLDSNVDIINGISRETAFKMQACGIYKIRELLNYLPNDYLDFSQIVHLGKARLNRNCSVIGKVHELEEKTVKNDMKLIERSMSCADDVLICTFFKQPWILKQFEKGDKVIIGGKLVFNFGFKRMTNPFVNKLDEEQEIPLTGQIIPRYESF